MLINQVLIRLYYHVPYDSFGWNNSIELKKTVILIILSIGSSFILPPFIQDQFEVMFGHVCYNLLSRPLVDYAIQASLQLNGHHH